MPHQPLIRRFMATAVVCVIAPLSFNSHAQTAPGDADTDAGRILQETLPEADYQPLSPSVDINLQGEPLSDSEIGGAKVPVEHVEFTGNTVFGDSRLRKELEELIGREHDMAGLEDMGNRISRFYRENDYPFARAFLPRQDVSQGTLNITVVEGKYGQVSARGDDAELAARVEPFLSRLKAGEAIQGSQLERTALLVGDLPGLTVMPVMRPGEAPGTGDLEVNVDADRRVEGFVGVDNHGSRATGEKRAIVGMQANRLLTVGDQLSVTALYSEEDLWLGRLAYSLPIGYQGWRGEVSYARTEYSLRSPFDDFTGTADTSTLRFSYPLIRQQQTNLKVSVGGEYTELNDRFDGTSFQKRYGHNFPLALQFDHRDGLGRGGVTFGEARVQSGQINNRDNAAVDGGYTKANVRLSRLQSLGHGFTLLASGNVQWADKALDSSQGKSLGGASTVRAYPVGEISGSRVWLAQLEVRYQATAAITPYAFFDQGARWDFADESSESIAGGGAGVRYAQDVWAIDALVATPTTGDAASEDEQKDPRIWFSARYSF